MSILVITTGGTIGALPYDDAGHPPFFTPMPTDGTDFVQKALTENFAAIPSRCVPVEPRDSKNIDEAYLKNLLEIMAASVEDKIILTHGTDRLLQSAAFFFAQCSDDARLRNKTILLTGSMIPLANGPDSDGYQNLEFALRQLDGQGIGAGVFIVLCDYADSEAETGPWQPRLYSYEPGAYEKVYTQDARYNRLRRA